MSERAEEWPTLKLIERNQSLPRLLRAMAASDNAKDRGHDLILSVAADIVEGSASTIRTLTAQLKEARERYEDLKDNHIEATEAIRAEYLGRYLAAESSLASLRERVRPQEVAHAVEAVSEIRRALTLMASGYFASEQTELSTAMAFDAGVLVPQAEATERFLTEILSTLPHDGEGI